MTPRTPEDVIYDAVVPEPRLLMPEDWAWSRLDSASGRIIADAAMEEWVRSVVRSDSARHGQTGRYPVVAGRRASPRGGRYRVGAG